MYELPHELSNDLENEKILVKSRNWVHNNLVPNLPCRNKKLAIALRNWIKLAIKLSMKDGIHLLNLFVSLKVFCKEFVGLNTDLKTHKKVVYDNVTNHVTIKSLW